MNFKKKSLRLKSSGVHLPMWGRWLGQLGPLPDGWMASGGPIGTCGPRALASYPPNILIYSKQERYYNLGIGHTKLASL